MDIDKPQETEFSSTSATAASQQEQPYWASKPSVAPIKAEYVLWDKLAPGSRSSEQVQEDASNSSSSSGLPGPPAMDDDDAAEGRPTTDRNGNSKPSDLSRSNEDGPPRKKARNNERGQNKGRKFARKEEEVKLCNFTARGMECQRSTGEGEQQLPQCRNSHDLKSYLQDNKESEIELNLPEEMASTSSKATICPLFENLGVCPFGFRCRLLSSHLTRHDDPSAGFQSSGLSLIQDLSKLRSVAPPSLETEADLLNWAYDTRGEQNVVTAEKLYFIRKTKTADLPLTKAYLTSIGEPLDTRNLDGKGGGRGGRGGKRGGRGGRQRDGGWQERGKKEEDEASELEKPNQEEAPGATISGAGFDESRAADAEEVEHKPEAASATSAAVDPSMQAAADSKDAREVSLRPVEKKRLNFENKLYLAPLTTVGNLPFRRLCVQYGCDITCGEMGLAQEYMVGNKSEFSLVRRHPSEKIFGVQIAANKVQTAMAATELIASQCNDVDFYDLNCGCPIDLVTKKGAGSALLDHSSKLGKILAGMNLAAGSTPITIKMRTGIKTGVNTTHKLMPRIVKDWPIGAATLHGRTQQQRYSKSADYDYIKTCVDSLRRTAEELDIAPIPFFGNGDAYDHRSYWQNVEETGVDGIMIARGALIKPWIFTEIRERRDWDISSRERLDMIGDLAKFGLEHWGSDTMGVNTTRRFLCEALSFQYRYVPVGLLERLPARMNDRPYPFKGRDDLETLLASGNSADWVNISEMFLGPSAPEFNFIAKHKSNSYSIEESNG